MTETGRAPTITTVAARAGVSAMTVSRVLSGRAGVRPELADRVRRAVDELGYRRNEQARSLRPGQRSGLIGVLITNLANPYYAEFLLGADQAVSASGRRLIIASTEEDPEREGRLAADLIGRQVEGMIVVPTGARQALQPDALNGTPVVLASRSVPGVRADAVLLADVPASYEQTSRLIRDGHHRIGFLGTTASVFTGRRRLEGFRLAHDDAGLAVEDDLVLAAQSDVSSAERAMNLLLDRPQPPTAVFCANNRNTVGAVRALLSRRPGPAVSLVSFDSFEFADLLGLPITVIDHDPAELGRQAAAMLLERLEPDGRDQAPRTIELPTRILTFGPQHSPLGERSVVS